MRKKVFFLTAVLFCSLATVQAQNPTGSCGPNLTWELDLNNNTLTISGSGAMQDYNGSDMPWISYRDSISTIVIGDSVTSIGDNAFAGCSNLDSVNIPNSVQTIGGSAFIGCSSLKFVKIGNSVTSIGERAFNKCCNLTSIIIPNNVTSIGNNAFEECYSLISVTIPNSIVSIGNYVFYNCSNLKSINIPNSVQTIGQAAFRGCQSLTSVIIPNSVRGIGQEAFTDCKSLTSINIPDSITNIEYVVFAGCSNLTSITIPNKVTSIGQSAFWGCSSLTSVTIGNSVTTIGHSAFEGCKNLTSVTIPNSVQTIGDNAFQYCNSLTSVTIPASVMSIGFGAFCNCTSLTSILVNSANPKYTSVNGVLFNYAKDTLVQYPAGKPDTNYKIPSTVTFIGHSSFPSSNNLTSVTIPNSVQTIGNWAFHICRNLKSVIIPNTVNDIGNDAFAGCSSLKFVIVPNSVTSIGERTFDYCSNLKSVILGNNVKTIGNNAFANCSILDSVTIPNSVTDIGSWVFANCLGLTSVIFGNSLKTIGDHAFYGCKSLTSVTIPNSVTTIGEYSFIYCSSLMSVTIPNSVTTIVNHAFNSCSGLKDIYVHWAKPLSVPTNIFENVKTDTINLHVPNGTQSRYAVAPVWQDFNIVAQPGNAISGIVRENPTTEYTTGQVALYRRLSGEAYAFTPFPVAVTNIGSSGEYLFIGIEDGEYLVRANPASSDSAIYSPTYYGNTVYWDSSIVVKVQGNISIDTVDITLVPFWKDTATGNTRIEGEVVCKGQGAPPPPKDTGISLDKDINGMWQTVAFTYLTLTDSNGTFTFENLPAGKYRVRLNMTGYNADTTLPTAGNSDTFKVRFEIPIPPLSVRPFAKEEGKIKVYPNPTSGQLTIDNGQLTINSVELFDIYGRNVTPLTPHSSPLILDISHLAKGMYFLKIGNKVVKIIKN